MLGLFVCDVGEKAGAQWVGQGKQVNLTIHGIRCCTGELVSDERDA